MNLLHIITQRAELSKDLLTLASFFRHSNNVNSFFFLKKYFTVLWVFKVEKYRVAPIQKLISFSCLRIINFVNFGNTYLCLDKIEVYFIKVDFIESILKSKITFLKCLPCSCTEQQRV